MAYRVIDLTLSLDTNAYGSGDVLAATQAMEGVAYNGDPVKFEHVTVIDQDDQGAAFTIYVFESNVALGTENAAPNISDADAVRVAGQFAIATGDYTDLGGVRVAFKTGGFIAKPASGNTFYVAVLNSTGTPTYTAAGIKLKFGVSDA